MFVSNLLPISCYCLFLTATVTVHCCFVIATATVTVIVVGVAIFRVTATVMQRSSLAIE